MSVKFTNRGNVIATRANVIRLIDSKIDLRKRSLRWEKNSWQRYRIRAQIKGLKVAREYLKDSAPNRSAIEWNLMRAASAVIHYTPAVRTGQIGAAEVNTVLKAVVVRK
jgi:stage V sporulation protein SpoVS